MYCLSPALELNKQQRICPLQYSGDRTNLPKRLKSPRIPISSRLSIRHPDSRLSASAWYITNLFTRTMLCPICGWNNMSHRARCETETCKALLSTKDFHEYYNVTNKERSTTKMAPIEHYIGTSDGKEVAGVPDGEMKDVVIQIRLFDFRALIVVAENCGKNACRMVPSCEHRGVKISFAQKDPDDVLEGSYKATETAVFP
ncbi:hypothetical protein BHYA_0052g00060 [Botrytis hyacinthi]|uniref:Uncharacterized protein n=1 Tax=Botrytis hyacinthi TaxID=278943 RepID=A0A4Z1H247_9HELO|nr:hypothetical protein BHYA_0052g00060 [Botrytis hyacinthi]